MWYSREVTRTGETGLIFGVVLLKMRSPVSHIIWGMMVTVVLYKPSVRSAITNDASSPTAVSCPVRSPRRLDFAPKHSHQPEEQQQQQQKRTHSPPPLLPRRSTRESRPPERYVPQR
ncbi:hypothetical protein Pcinc_017523 [Petrolisthes cinctipes]|uniref:Uncharacterized protein n=1 Tax=Petrolisthes cinctipes TaxID=88211 RepID=A0AAE1KNE9_PETCI|nr:hypothetical protein Pcinc_017523 [Petrolisthes cinctipes]